MRWFYSQNYDYGAGVPGQPTEVHGFVLDKPSRIRRALIAAGVAGEADFECPEPARLRDFEGLHDARVLAALRDREAVADAVELPALALLPADVVQRAVVEPQLHAAGGTCAALAAARTGGWAANLSGGYHHARPDLSHGFCLVNDVALAVHRLGAAGKRPRIVIADLDLHQGDGNARFFADARDVFTFSMHEGGIFPNPKARSDLDVALRSYTGDDEYLAHLDDALAEIERRFAPQIVIYVAGSDPYQGDPLGSLELSAEGMEERDRRMARFAAKHRCGLVVLPAGGYSAESPLLTAVGLKAIAEVECARATPWG